MNARSTFSELKFHFKNLFPDTKANDQPLPSTQPTEAVAINPTQKKDSQISFYNSQPDINICNNKSLTKSLNCRHYNFRTLGPNFCSLVSILFLYVGGNDPSADLKIVCHSCSEQIPMNSQLAISVTRLLKNYMKRPMRKTPNGDFEWSVSFKNYKSILKTFKDLKFDIEVIPAVISIRKFFYIVLWIPITKKNINYQPK